MHCRTCGVLFCTGHPVHGPRQGVLRETTANHLLTPASKQSQGPVVQAGSPSLLQRDGAQALMPVPPQQPVTNPWMERLLQELSFDDAQVDLLNTILLPYNDCIAPQESWLYVQMSSLKSITAVKMQ